MAHEEVARGQIERRPVAVDHAQCEQRLRRHTIVIVGVQAAVHRPDAGVAHAGEERALHRDLVSEPHLAGRAQRKRGARYANTLGRRVAVAAVKAPDAAIALAGLVLLADQQAARRHALDGVRAGCADLEAEVVPRAVVVIAGLSRQPVVHRVVHQQLVALYVGRVAGLVNDGAARADLHPALVPWALSVEDFREAVVERTAIEAGPGPT